MKADCVDYRELPGQNPLFLRYLYDFDQVRAWYPAGSPDPDLLKRRAQDLISARSYPRQALADALDSFNREVGSAPPALANIARLREKSVVAVVTGQQIGLFGGPALAVYKAITAVKLAGMLTEQGVQAVPVFWLASDDSDFDEIASSFLLDDQGSLLEVSCAGSGEPNGIVGGMPVNGLDPSFDELGKRATAGMFRAEVLSNLRAAYAPGRTLRHAFGAWMAQTFKEEGLVLYDALCQGVKTFLTAAYLKAVSQRQSIVASLAARESELRQAGLEPQVKVEEDETLLFRFSSGRRFKVEAINGRYRVQDGVVSEVDAQGVQKWLAEEPDGFGPNVLLRPILQDQLFPTVAYVAGPAEIAYFAQVNAIAPLWNQTPLVIPRAGVTLVDAKAQRLLAKYRLEVRDVIGWTQPELTRRLARDGEALSLIEKFDRLESVIRTEVEVLREDIERIESTAARRLGRSREKMLYQLTKSRERFIRNYANKASDLGRHVAFLHNSLYPREGLQERTLNFNHFLAVEGPSLVGRLAQAVQPFCKEHQVIYVPTS